MLQVRLWLNNWCGFLHFDLRSCPTARRIKPKEVPEAVWTWSWSSSAVSAGGAAWPTSRTKRCSTAVQRPDTREWLTPREGCTLPTRLGCKPLGARWVWDLHGRFWPFALCYSWLLAVTLRWTRDRWLLLVRSPEKSRWVPVRPIPHSKNFPLHYDVGLASSNSGPRAEFGPQYHYIWSAKQQKSHC